MWGTDQNKSYQEVVNDYFFQQFVNESIFRVGTFQFTDYLWMIHWLSELIQFTDSMIQLWFKSTWGGRLPVNTILSFSFSHKTSEDWKNSGMDYFWGIFW